MQKSWNSLLAGLFLETVDEEFRFHLAARRPFERRIFLGHKMKKNEKNEKRPAHICPRAVSSPFRYFTRENISVEIFRLFWVPLGHEFVLLRRSRDARPATCNYFFVLLSLSLFHIFKLFFTFLAQGNSVTLGIRTSRDKTLI